MPVISFEGGETHFLEGSGLPVGLFEEPEWEQFEIPLPEPFHLFLFSDGLVLAGGLFLVAATTSPAARSVATFVVNLLQRLCIESLDLKSLYGIS